MSEASDTFGILHQNLVDAGCNNKDIKTCMDYAKNGEWNKINVLLKNYKKELLKRVFLSEEQIDCLDFLIYQINKEKI